MLPDLSKQSRIKASLDFCAMRLWLMLKETVYLLSVQLALNILLKYAVDKQDAQEFTLKLL